VEIAPDLGVVRADRRRLLEVLQNLVENAAKFSSGAPAPRIEIGARRDGDEPVFFVKDNGRGIEPRFLERVFELFEKLDAGAEGTGVGLALVRRIVEAHGGRAWAESDGPGRGATFCFTLPRPDTARL
jgi:signal transduction histidine kinase